MERRTEIDLRKRKEENHVRHMEGHTSFIAFALSEKKLDEMSVLAELLSKVGIGLTVERYENADTGSEYDMVSFTVNEAQYDTITTRHAGRKSSYSDKYRKYGECTVEELREKLKLLPKTKVAEELGCSRMTLYRILHNIAEQKPEGYMSIWHYTC